MSNPNPHKPPKGVRIGGRKKGTPNHALALKDMILEALKMAGGIQYLTDRAKDEPKAFIALLGRVLPTQIGGFEGGVPIIVQMLPQDANA